MDAPFVSIQDGARKLALFALAPYGANPHTDWMARRIVQGVLDDLADLEASGKIRSQAVPPPSASPIPTRRNAAGELEFVTERRVPLSEAEVAAALAPLEPTLFDSPSPSSPSSSPDFTGGGGDFGGGGASGDY